MSETTLEHAFSLSDDGVYDWHTNIEDAIEEMRVYDEDCRTLYMGEVRQFTHGDLLDVKTDIIENMQERAYDEAGEFTDAYLDDIPKEKLSDLHRVIAEWLDANAPQPVFFVVDNSVEIEVQLDCDGEYVSHRVVDRPTEA